MVDAPLTNAESVSGRYGGPIDREATVMKKWSRQAAFAHFGAKCRNPRWSWSGRSADGKTVVMTMWEDEIKNENGKIVYGSRGRPPDEGKRHGAVERLENLKWALNHCEGLVRVVVAVARDKTAVPREAESWFPHQELVMKITHLDETTGAFRAENVSIA
jgi:hypothetical protein